VGRQPPLDAFRGAWWAIVAEPGGNDIGLMTRVVKSRRTWPHEQPPDPEKTARRPRGTAIGARSQQPVTRDSLAAQNLPSGAASPYVPETGQPRMLADISRPPAR